jgi:group I intron endonuclease
MMRNEMTDQLISKSGTEIIAHWKTKERIQCIYAITHNPTGRRYIGQSVNVAIRWRDHAMSLMKGLHKANMAEAWRRDGPASFTFSVVELVESQCDLTAREGYWISKYFDGGRGFNTFPAIDGPDKMQISETQRFKMIESQQHAQKIWRERLRKAKLAAPPP